MTTEITQGRIKFINPCGEFGFIKTENEDVYIHISEVPDIAQLQAGDLVEFQRQKNRRGWAARNVVVLEKGKPKANFRRRYL